MNPDPAERPGSGRVDDRRSTSGEGDNYKPGNTVHFIQAKKAYETRHEAEVGRIVRIDERGVHVRVAGELRRYFTRDLERLEALVTQFGSKVRIQQRWSLMRLRTHLFSIRGPL